MYGRGGRGEVASFTEWKGVIGRHAGFQLRSRSSGVLDDHGTMPTWERGGSP